MLRVSLLSADDFYTLTGQHVLALRSVSQLGLLGIAHGTFLGSPRCPIFAGN